MKTLVSMQFNNVLLIFSHQIQPPFSSLHSYFLFRLLLFPLVFYISRCFPHLRILTLIQHLNDVYIYNVGAKGLSVPINITKVLYHKTLLCVGCLTIIVARKVQLKCYAVQSHTVLSHIIFQLK